MIFSAGFELLTDLGQRFSQETEALGNQNELGCGCNLQLFHDPAAMGLDRSLGRSKLIRDFLVQLPPSNAFEDLAFARRQTVYELQQR